MKPKIGQELFSLNIGNAASRYREPALTRCVVVKVGRKYFTCRRIGDSPGMGGIQYHIDGWREKSNYAPTSRLYDSEQAWEDEKEISRLSEAIYKAFEYGRNKRGLPLESIREIYKLTKAVNTEQ